MGKFYKDIFIREIYLSVCAQFVIWKIWIFLRIVFFHLKLNGLVTLQENIADNVGVERAFEAFQKSQQKKPSQTLPDLNLDVNQLFYISYANVSSKNLRI